MYEGINYVVAERGYILSGKNLIFLKYLLRVKANTNSSTLLLYLVYYSSKKMCVIARIQYSGVFRFFFS